MEDLMNDNIPFEGNKIRLLESIIQCLTAGEQKQLNEANLVLEKLKNETNFWIHTQSIIQNTTDSNTIFFAFQTLQEAVSKKWNLLDSANQLQIRNFILETIISWCSIQNPSPHIRICINKLNSVLVEIVKREWRTTWKTALSDIIMSSYKNETICSNNLKILKELSGEIFDYEKKNMTSTEINELKNEFVNEFQSVYQLCNDVMSSFIQNPSGVNHDLIKICINTLHAFLVWMPPVYVLTTNLIDGILIHLLKEKKFLIATLKCFEQIFKITLDDFESNAEICENLKVKLILNFGAFLDILSTNYKLGDSFEVLRLANSKREFKYLNYFNQTTQGFAITIFNFFQTHAKWILVWIQTQGSFIEIVNKLKFGLCYMAAFTEVKDPILFKNCVDFWNFFLKNMNQDPNSAKPSPVLNLSPNSFDHIKTEFSKPLTEMIMFLVMRVPKPQEVRIIIDEQGLPKREELVDSENSMIYETVKEIIRLYALENYMAMKNIIVYKLESQVNLVDWSYENLNSVCWATACLADLRHNVEERNLFISVLRTLLSLCAMKKSLDDKIVIASNIMHIVSQNYVYLKDITSFLGIVVKKLLDFCEEKSDEIIEMACNTLIKIGKSLGPQLVQPLTSLKGNLEEPLIHMVLDAIPGLIPNLSIIRKIDFYEAVGYIIAAEKDEQTKIGFLIRASADLEKTWINVCTNAGNRSFFLDINNTNTISLFLRINANFCASIGPSYKLYFERCFGNLDQIYEIYYVLICEMISQYGIQTLAYSEMKKYRGVRKDIINFFQNFILIHKDNSDTFVANYSRIFNKIIEIFIHEISETKEAEVFEMISASLSVLSRQSISTLLSSLPLILESTLPMITQDFTSYPEVRIAFFGLLKSISNNCFEIILNLEANCFKTIVNCLLWAIRHEIMTIHEVGMEALIAFLMNINQNSNFINQFYKIYFEQIINELLFVTTDKMHQNGFGNQAKCLYILFRVVPSFEFKIGQGSEENNMLLYKHILGIMTNAFSNLDVHSHETSLQKLIIASMNNEKEFKVTLKDYLISLSLFTGGASKNEI